MPGVPMARPRLATDRRTDAGSGDRGADCINGSAIMSTATREMDAGRQSRPGATGLSGRPGAGAAGEAGQSRDHIVALHAFAAAPVARPPWSRVWTCSLSYGRVLQNPPRKAWRVRDENLASGGKALAVRARGTSAASLGICAVDLEAAYAWPPPDPVAARSKR